MAAATLRTTTSHTTGQRPSINDQAYITESCKLGTFLALSERSKTCARNSLLRHSRKTDDRKNRKSSILTSLDKFLDDNEDDATDTTSYQSSFSSGLSSEASSVSFPRSLPPRVESTLEEEPTLEVEPPRRRFQRRGSVTKYSLDEVAEQTSTKELSVNTMPISSNHEKSEASLEKKKIKKKKSLSSPSTLENYHNHKTKSTAHSHSHSAHNKKSSEARPGLSKESSMNRSSSHKPSPMRETSMHSITNGNCDDDDASITGSIATIDARPLPMRFGDSTKSFDNSFSDSFRGVPSRGGKAATPKATPSFESCASTATMSSFEDDDNSYQLHKPPRPSPQRARSGSLSGLSNLPGAPSGSCHDDHLQDDQSVGSQCESVGRQRYQRRGSITKFSLENSAEPDAHASASHLPPRPSKSQQGLGNMLDALSGSSSHDDRLQDDRSVASGPGEGRQRYRRRGSVTKFSLEDGLKSLDNNHQPVCRNEDDRSVHSEGYLPPRPARTLRKTPKASMSDSAKTPPKKPSLGGMLSALPSMELNDSAHASECDDRSVNSDGILGGARQRYRRRGSVTKYSIGGGSGGDSDPLAAASSHADDDDDGEPRTPNRRFTRRGSVTKFSLGNMSGLEDTTSKPPRPPRI